MRFIIVDRGLNLLGLELIALGARGVEIAEQHAELAGVGLTQEGVDFLDQRRDAGLFVHRLIGQRTEFAAQRGNHPARQIDVAALGGAEMLLDRDHLLLRDEAVPAAERLGVVGGIGVIGSHIGAHDPRGVAGDVEAGAELVLGAHARDALAADAVPGAIIVADEAASLCHVFLITHRHILVRGDGWMVAKVPPKVKSFVNNICEIWPSGVN